VKLSYNNAPSLMYWWLDGYVNFSAQQKPSVKQQLTHLQSWHREKELPQYADFLRRIDVLAPDNVKPEQVCNLFDEAKLRMQSFNSAIVPVVQSISPNLTSLQLQNIEKKFAESNDEWREQWMDDNPDKLLKKRLETALDRAESFYGKLSIAQKDLLRASIQGSSFSPEISYKRRISNQQKILSLLHAIQRAELSSDQANIEMHAFMRQLISPEDPDFAAYVDKLSAESCQTLANLHNSSTAKQRENLRDYFQGYLNSFNELMVQGK